MRSLGFTLGRVLVVAWLLVLPVVGATPQVPFRVSDQAEGTEDYVMQLAGSVGWVIDESGAFVDALREELQRCLVPGSGC